MGQSSSKKQKKQKPYDQNLSRTTNSRQSRHLNNTNSSNQKSALNQTNIVKNDIKPHEPQQKPPQDTESKVTNTATNTKSVNPNNINNISREDGKSDKDLEPLRPNGNMKPAEDDARDMRKNSAANNVATHKECSVEIRTKNAHGEDSPDMAPTKIIRSASAGGGDHGYSAFRKLSMRESREFRRRQYYNHIFNNTSQFDKDQGIKHFSDGPPLTKRESLQSFHNFEDDIKEYDVEQYPEELRVYAENLNKIERDLKGFSKSQITVYFPTMKDDLHNNWRKVFAVRLTGDNEKGKKIEMINRIKFDLDILNSRYLGRKLLFVRY